VDTLRIEWPSGFVQDPKEVAPRQILTVTEPARLVPHGAGSFQIQCWIKLRAPGARSLFLGLANKATRYTLATQRPS